MSTIKTTGHNSFVLLHAAGQRFALPARIVVELAPPVQLHTFPHTSERVLGVIVRRGRIVPVYDVAHGFLRPSSSHRFYLIAQHDLAPDSELGAIPVDGECEMVTGDLQPVRPNRPGYICGSLAIGAESLDVLDFHVLITTRTSDRLPTNAPSPVESGSNHECAGESLANTAD